MNDSLGIGIMTSINLQKRYKSCLSTWVKDFDNVYFFGGDNSNEFDELLIPIKNAGEDWNSAFLKQQMGLKYMFEKNPDLNWYCIVGCDTILFKYKILEELSKFDENEDFLLSQPCGVWTDKPMIHEVSNLFDSNCFRSFAGGAGFFLSNSLMKKLYKFIDQFNEEWSATSGRFYGCSDVALAYMVKKYFNVQLTHLIYMLSQAPEHYKDEVAKKNYSNYPIDVQEILKTPISLHYIKPEIMNDIYLEYNRSEKNKFNKMIKLHYGGQDHLFSESDILTPALHYSSLCLISSDINEHLPTIKKYAEECATVVEMGVRFACSTWAFIEAKPKKLTCVDINYDYFQPSESFVKKACENYGIDFKWITGDSLKLEIEQTDLLMIDTLHTYLQLKKELEKHHSRVNKYIILHDTISFAYRNESIYQHASDEVKDQYQEFEGLMPAVYQFLETHKEWDIKEVFTNNNGLTILERKN